MAEIKKFIVSIYFVEKMNFKGAKRCHLYFTKRIQREKKIHSDELI
jgi:hypothetical protein